MLRIKTLSQPEAQLGHEIDRLLNEDVTTYVLHDDELPILIHNML
jgi:hypothetical protein